MITQFKNKKIGIWGLGVIGRAAIKLFHSQDARISVCDIRDLQAEEYDLLEQYNVNFIQQKNIDTFLQEHDYILPSPGIDTRSYSKYHHKFITELDLFAALCKKPIITITGSIGKTTVTSLLGQSLNQQKISTVVGGNIGIASFDLLSQQNHADYIVLEVSSFQLEHVTSFAPYLAIWTNFYPNHLDRHATSDGYFQAKYNSIIHAQQALVPFAIAHKLPKTTSKFSFFSSVQPTQKQLETYKNNSLFFIHDKKIIVYAKEHYRILAYLNQLPAISFADNWLVVCAALYLLDALPRQFANNYQLPEHRVEKVATINNITFYNDSKATIPEATLAAVSQFSNKSIHLFLGGLSKGLDRSILIKQLKNKVVYIYCFGKEAELLQTFCKHEQIAVYAAPTLDDAFAYCVKQIKPGDIVLLSPSGSSYDLFKNYEERGTYFKRLVKLLLS